MSFKENMRNNPVLWLVIGLPILSIVAGVYLVYRASTAGGHDVSPDEVRRVAQVQQTDLGPDHKAMQMNLSAVLREQDGKIILNSVTGTFPQQPLVLHLRHPIQSDLDITVQLQPESAKQWQADGVLLAAHDWNASVLSVDGSWRIFGRLPAGQYAVRLAHAFDHAQGERLDAVRGVAPVDVAP